MNTVQLNPKTHTSADTYLEKLFATKIKMYKNNNNKKQFIKKLKHLTCGNAVPKINYKRTTQQKTERKKPEKFSGMQKQKNKVSLKKGYSQNMLSLHAFMILEFSFRCIVQRIFLLT